MTIKVKVKKSLALKAGPTYSLCEAMFDKTNVPTSFQFFLFFKDSSLSV